MMLLSSVFVLFTSGLLSAAQSLTASAAVPTHTVAVGADPHKFTPKEVNASVGDIIEFRFYPTNHSVARAEYLLPCIPYEVTGVNKVGFWSGFKPISIVGNDLPQYQVRINDTKPVFFYCGAPGACQNDGMMGVINPNATQTWTTQHAFALNSTQAFVPGEYFSPEGVPTSVPTTTSATSTSTSSSPPATSTTISASVNPTQAPVAASAGNSSGLSTGAIAGIAVGAAAIAVLAAALFYLYGRQRTMKEVLQTQKAPSFAGRDSYFSGHTSPISPYPFGGHKSPVIDIDERSSSGRDRSSGVRLMGGQHSHNDPLASDGHHSHSPPIDERDHEILFQTLSQGASGTPSPDFPRDYERLYESINNSSRTSNPGVSSAEMDDEQTAQQHGSEMSAREVPVSARAAEMILKGTNAARTGVHEMPVPSRNTSAARPYKPSNATTTGKLRL